MLHKGYTATFKALDDETGTFEAIVSTDAVDKVGDRVLPSSIKKSIDTAQSAGRRLPLMWSHTGWKDPEGIVGSIDPSQVRIAKHSISMRAQLNLESAKARAIYRAMKDGVLSEFSIGGFERSARKAADGANEILEFDLREVSVCMSGINPETTLLAIKAAAAEDAVRERAALKGSVDVEIEGTYEERMADLQEALGAAYPAPAGGYSYICLLGTTDADVIYKVCTDDGEEAYRVSYTVADDGTIALGEPEAVAFQAVPDTDEKTEPAPAPAAEAPVATWAYTDEEWRAACVLDRGGDGTAKERYALPIAPPGKSTSDPDAGSVHAAASRIGHAEAPDAAKRDAAKKLVRAYGHLGAQAPEAVTALANGKSDSPEAKLAEAARALHLQTTAQRLDDLVGEYGARTKADIEARERIAALLGLAQS